jgi:outer membrane protein assembly factor BamD
MVGMRLFPALVFTVAAATLSACASSGRGAVPPGTPQPDRFLFDRGNEALEAERWLTAREYFKQVTETYTQSPYRPDAKLGVGDTYLGENTAEALVLAINEFQEFLSFYPTHARADYAQYKLGMAHYRQMRAPQRDQSETRAALRDFEAFVTRYPNSALLPEVQAKVREIRDRLSEADFSVGLFYYRQRWYPGAIDRLTAVMKENPEYSRRDRVYFYLGESLIKVDRNAEALPYFERLIAEFEESEHLEDARQRVATIKTPAAAKTPL